MANRVDIYDALKDRVGKEAARMLAESIPLGDELDARIDRLEERLGARIALLQAELTAKIEASQKETTRWMLGFFAPLWVGVYGVLALVVVNVLKS